MRVHTLKSFLDDLSARAESDGHPGAMRLSDWQAKLILGLAQREGALHPSDEKTFAADGYEYMTMRKATTAPGCILRYRRRATQAEIEREQNRLMQAARDAALAAYRESGDSSHLKRFLAQYPES